MKKTTVKGTYDYLPNEMALRDYLQNKILKVYQNNGFFRISTPIMEDVDNLDKSEGGDNLNLIFRILKRGDKLAETIENSQFGKLSDLGLRYDLTLPLSRYFANNKEKLMLPMKCIQIDKVYRAERPQKGRNREFVQCDIDIIGSDSLDAEIELIYTTSKALKAVGITDFTIKINDRRLLKSMLASLGVENSKIDSVCITIDKLDKIGIPALSAELLEKGLSKDTVRKLEEILGSPLSLARMMELTKETRIVQGLQRIISSITDLSGGTIDIRYEFTLVRGQGYYTGTIFEVESRKFKGSIGGGGRYDNLIGKFTGEQLPAVGFSIGFERIYSLLKEMNFEIPDTKQRIAVIYQKEDFLDAYGRAELLREDYDISLFEMPKKLGKFLDKLFCNGFYGFAVYGENLEIKPLTNHSQ